MRKPIRISVFALLILTALVLVPHLADSDAGGSAAYLGVAVDMVAAHEDGRVVGLRVSKVAKDSPAELAGLRVHDVLLSLAGRTPDSEAVLSAILHSVRPGQHVRIEVLRNATVLALRATLRKRPR